MHVSARLFAGIDIEKICPQISLKQEEKDKALDTQGNTIQCSDKKGTKIKINSMTLQALVKQKT
jgi:hypothetical protein